MTETHSSDATFAPFARRVEQEIASSMVLDGIPELSNEQAIFDNADVLARRIRIPEQLLRFLHARTRWQPMPFEEWSHAVRAATAIDHILRTSFRPRLGKFDALIENKESFGKVSKGALLISYHGAFIKLTRALFADGFPGGFQLNRRLANPDPRGALFAGLRALQDGASVMMAPDGRQGTATVAAEVFGIEFPVGIGAPFLAFTASCETVWYILARRQNRFAIQLEKGPKRQGEESLKSFQQRFFQFYAAKIEERFTGDPRSISLSPKWRRIFANHIGLEQGESLE